MSSERAPEGRNRRGLSPLEKACWTVAAISTVGTVALICNRDILARWLTKNLPDNGDAVAGNQPDLVKLLCEEGFFLPFDEGFTPPEGAFLQGIVNLNVEGDVRSHWIGFAGKFQESMGCAIQPDGTVFPRSFTLFLTQEDSALLLRVLREDGTFEDTIYPLNVTDLSEVLPKHGDRAFSTTHSPFPEPPSHPRRDSLILVDPLGNPVMSAHLPFSDDGLHAVVRDYFWDDLKLLVDVYGEEHVFVTNGNGALTESGGADGFQTPDGKTLVYRPNDDILARSITAGDFWLATKRIPTSPNP